MTNKTTILGALGIESVDDVINTDVATSQVVEVVPGETEVIELDLKEQAQEANELAQTATTFGEVKEGLEALRDQMVSMRGKQVSAESFALMGLSMRSQLGRILLTPRSVTGLEAFAEELPEVGVAPAGTETTETKITVDEPDTAPVEAGEEITKEEADKANTSGKDIGDAGIKIEGDASPVPAVVSNEDETDLGGVAAATVTEDEQGVASDVDAIADVADGTIVTEEPAATADEAVAAVAEVAEAAADAQEVVAEATDKPRVEITITDDQLEVAIESLNVFIDRLAVGQEGLVDKAVKSISDTVAGVFKGYKSVADRANNVIVALRGATGDATGEISTSSAHKLSYEGKVDLASINAGLKATKTVGKIVTEDVPKATARKVATLAKDYLKRSEEVRKGIAAGMTDHNFEAFTSADTKMGTDLAAIFPSTAGVSFLGGKKLVVSKQKAAEGAGEFNVIAIEADGAKVATAASIPTPTVAETTALAKNILDVSKYLLEREEVVSLGNKELREALASINELHTDNNTKDLGKSLRRVRWLYSWVNRSYNSVVSDFSSTAFSSLRSAVELAEKAAKQYKK